ncbi:MAG: hypothetical protein WBH01_10320 [Dehalococcoidia bacterium]
MTNGILEQFVEGFNEAAEQSYEDAIEITRFAGIGIEYTPSVNYIPTRLEIMLSFGRISPKRNLTVQISSDYRGKPSDIELTSGSLAPKKEYGDWNEIELKPVLLIRDRKYWLIINPNRCPTALIQAKTGDEYELSMKQGERWVTPEGFKSGKVMVRFYGKIASVS